LPVPQTLRNDKNFKNKTRGILINTKTAKFKQAKLAYLQCNGDKGKTTDL